MSLVGDIILELRSRIPDAPAVHNPPILNNLTTGFLPGGQFQPGSAHVIAATVTTNWGETYPSNQLPVTLGPSDNVIIANISLSAAQAINVNVYEAGLTTPLTGTADMWTLPAVQGAVNYAVGVTPFVHSALPTRSTAFLPDADGNFIGGFMVYRLLNRSLQEMIKIGGGIVDVTGVRSIVNTSMYRLASPFYTFVNAWYDGYPMDVVPRNMMFLRNSAAGFSGILSYEQDGPQSVIQVWPQSNRSGGLTTLITPMDDEQDTIPLVDGSGFLSIGLAKVDDEVMGFSSASPFPVTIPQPTSLRGVIRGLGGTDIVGHDVGAPVEELNLRLSGYRLAKTYKVGDSAQTLMVPPAWETPLVLHMLSQVRSMEQDDATSEKLLADFQSQADKIAKQSRLGRIKPRQIPIWGQQGTDARNVNGVGFGWLIQ